MTQLISISDAALSNRVDEIVKTLHEYYPDGKVSGLEAKHKALSNRVGRTWQQIGYASREEFFAAYGFESVRATGGRPVSVDGEEVIAKLAARYKDAPKPNRLDTLIYENPDLKRQLKTLSNKSNEVFGRTLSKELRDRGLLSGGRAPLDVPEADIEEMLCQLSAKYADVIDKPSTMPKLKADNPDYKDVIVAFNARCKSIYGVTPKKKLIDLGIYSRSAGTVVDADIEEIESAVDVLGEMLCDLSADSKPDTITRLAKAYPEQGEYIKAGNKKGVIDKGLLQQLGILASTGGLVKKHGVRRVPAEELLPLFVEVADETYIEPGDDAAKDLPPNVRGLDAGENVELRTALIAITGTPAMRANVGDKFEARVVDVGRWGWSREHLSVQVESEPPAEFRPIWSGSMYEGTVDESGSKLSQFVGATVVSKFEYKGNYVAQLEFNYLAALRSDTMIYMLRKMGIVTDADVTGGMGWRFRMRKVARVKSGHLSVDPAIRASESAPCPEMEKDVERPKNAPGVRSAAMLSDEDDFHDWAAASLAGADGGTDGISAPSMAPDEHDVMTAAHFMTFALEEDEEDEAVEDARQRAAETLHACLVRKLIPELEAAEQTRRVRSGLSNAGVEFAPTMKRDDFGALEKVLPPSLVDDMRACLDGPTATFELFENVCGRLEYDEIPKLDEDTAWPVLRFLVDAVERRAFQGASDDELRSWRREAYALSSEMYFATGLVLDKPSELYVIDGDLRSGWNELEELGSRFIEWEELVGGSLPNGATRNLCSSRMFKILFYKKTLFTSLDIRKMVRDASATDATGIIMAGCANGLMEKAGYDGAHSIYKFVGDAKRSPQNLFAGQLTAIDLMARNVLRVASGRVEEAGQKVAESKVPHRVACKRVEDAREHLRERAAAKEEASQLALDRDELASQLRSLSQDIEDAEEQLSQLGLFAFSKKGQLRELIDQKSAESERIREELEAKDVRLDELQKRIDDLRISTSDIEALEREAGELKAKVDVAEVNLERAKDDKLVLETLVSEVKRNSLEADYA